MASSAVSTGGRPGASISERRISERGRGAPPCVTFVVGVVMAAELIEVVALERGGEGLQELEHLCGGLIVQIDGQTHQRQIVGFAWVLSPCWACARRCGIWLSVRCAPAASLRR